MRAKSHFSLGLLALLMLGCAVSRSPRGYRADAEHMQTDVRGAWIQLKTLQRQTIAGELLAVDCDSLRLLVADGRVERLSWRAVRKARLEAWKTRTRSMVGLQGAGTALAIGHGWWGIITLPLWHLTGSVLTGNYTFDPIVTVPDGTWGDLIPFARYPGGLPANLGENELSLQLASDEPVSTRVLTMDEATIERAEERQSRLRLLEEASSPTAGHPFMPRPSSGPAGLPGAWVRGLVKEPAGLKPRLFAGELLAVDAQGLFLWAGGLRRLELKELSTCKVQSAAAGSRVLTLVGDLKVQDPLRFKRLCAYPAGLPSLGDVQLDHEALKAEKRAAWRYLNKHSRWPK